MVTAGSRNLPPRIRKLLSKKKCVTEAYINIDISVVRFYVDSSQLCSQIRRLLA